MYMQWQTQGRGGPPLFLDQTEAKRAEKFFRTLGPPFSADA